MKVGTKSLLFGAHNIWFSSLGGGCTDSRLIPGSGLRLSSMTGAIWASRTWTARKAKRMSSWGPGSCGSSADAGKSSRGIIPGSTPGGTVLGLRGCAMPTSSPCVANGSGSTCFGRGSRVSSGSTWRFRPTASIAVRSI